MMKFATRIAFSALILVLAGCSVLQPAPASDPQPTPDLNLVRTEAVQTVEARLTMDAALNPSPTVPPPTSTRPPATSTATTSAVLPPTITIPPPATNTSRPVPYVPKATNTPYTDMIRFIGQSPNDGAVFSPLEDFDIIWTVKNIGKRDWNQEFYVRYSSGVEGKSKLYYLTRGVDVGDTIDIRVDMLAPFPPGNYRTTWQLINDDGVVIGTLFLAFSVK